MSAVTEKEDLLCIIRQIRKLPYIDETAVYLWGESQGAYAAALAAAEVPELVRAEILLYPALNLADMGKAKFASKEAVTESTFLDVKLGARYYHIRDRFCCFMEIRMRSYRFPTRRKRPEFLKMWSIMSFMEKATAFIMKPAGW